MNVEQPVFLAKISAFEPDTDEYGCSTKARVIPLTAEQAPTRPFAINGTVRGKLGNLKVDSVVVCLRFENGDGIILANMDGSMTHDFDMDVTAEGVSLVGHTHTGVHGGTSAPN